jgi:hypothetical protein
MSTRWRLRRLSILSYTCGALLHGHDLVIPHAMSDCAASVATVSLDELLAAMV